jgi:uncharacterized protein (TIGR02271 family)
MAKTVTSLFQDQAKAADIVTRLEQSGIPRTDVSVYTGSEIGLDNNLADFGVPNSDAHAYAEGVRRGGSLVVVKCDDGQVDQVVSILDGEALDLDEQQTSWRSEGWADYNGAMGRTGSDATWDEKSRTGMTGRSDWDEKSRTGMTGRSDRDEVIPIAEEELSVGKRAVNQGRVRISAHTVERPVQEQVTLRDETVHVERRPASGEHRQGAMGGDPFKERTIEVEEHDEEAVVSKQARVKEELVVRKDVENRTETISDTVRSTEVDVEDDRTTRGTGTKGTTDRSR